MPIDQTKLDAAVQQSAIIGLSDADAAATLSVIRAGAWGFGVRGAGK